MANPSGKTLTAEDRILWGKVARTATPLHDGDAWLSLFDEEPAEPAPSTQYPSAAAVTHGKAGLPRAPKGPPPSGYDKPVRRKLEKGRLPLEARIDLHGMIQAEAHALLLSFLMRAHGHGMRHVLVITGKGSSMGSEGVLNRAVPVWFSTPSFRSIVAGYDQAAPRHGGSGAYYVRLQKLARPAHEAAP